MTQPAADDDGLDVDGEHEDAHRGGDALSKPSRDRARIPISVGRSGEQCANGKWIVGPPLTGDTGSAGDRLETAALPTRTERAGGIDGDVPDLARDAGGTPPELAVDDDPRGETRTEVEVCHRPGEAHQMVGAERCRLDVVLHPDVDAQPIGELAAER